MTVVIFMIVAFDDNGHHHNYDFSWQVWSEHSWGVQSGTEVGGDGKSQILLDFGKKNYEE